MYIISLKTDEEKLSVYFYELIATVEPLLFAKLKFNLYHYRPQNMHRGNPLCMLGDVLFQYGGRKRPKRPLHVKFRTI